MRSPKSARISSTRPTKAPPTSLTRPPPAWAPLGHRRRGLTKIPPLQRPAFRPAEMPPGLSAYGYTGNGRPLTRPFSNKEAKGRPSRSAFVRGPASGGTIIAGPAAEFPSPLERRPSPTVSPPGPASGPRDGGNAAIIAWGPGEGDKYFRSIVRTQNLRVTPTLSQDPS